MLSNLHQADRLTRTKISVVSPTVKKIQSISTVDTKTLVGLQ